MNDADRLRAQKRASTDPERLERMAQDEERRHMTTITDDERAPIRWLERMAAAPYASFKAREMARTILALLDAPRLPRPEDVPDEVLDEMYRAQSRNRGGVRSMMRDALQVHYDHYTAPPQPKGPWAIKAPDGSYEGVFIQRSDAERYLQRASGSRIVKLVEAAEKARDAAQAYSLLLQRLNASLDALWNDDSREHPAWLERHAKPITAIQQECERALRRTE